MKILVLEGPNLNLLGAREPEIYGSKTAAELHAELSELGQSHGAELLFFQSNHEGALIDRVQAAKSLGIQGLLVNAAGFSHTSVSLADALKCSGLPFVEVHISNVFAREPFRHRSYLSPIASGTVTGFGTDGYRLGLLGLLGLFSKGLGG